MKTYNGEDRVKQVQYLRELAADLAELDNTERAIAPADDAMLGPQVAEEIVGYYLEDPDWGPELPDWFDKQDRRLLVRYLGEALR